MALASPRILDQLLNSGMDLNRKDIFGRYPLEIAMRKGSVESLRKIIESGAEPYLIDWRGSQPFIHFAENGQADLVTLCLDRSVLIRNDKRLLRNAMDMAMRHGRTAVVRVLLEQDVFYDRMEGVDAVLKNASAPNDDPNAISDIRRLFEKKLELQKPVQ